MGRDFFFFFFLKKIGLSAANELTYPSAGMVLCDVAVDPVEDVQRAI